MRPIVFSFVCLSLTAACASPGDGTGATAAFPSLALAADGNAAALAGFAGEGAPPPVGAAVHVAARARAFECVQVAQSGAEKVEVSLADCGEANGQSFVFAADGTVQTTLDEVVCLQAQATGDVTAARCDNGPAQRWSAGGHLLQNEATGSCLARHDGTAAATALAVVTCDQGDARQAWAYGDPNAIATQAGALAAAFPAPTPALPAAGNAPVGFAALSAAPTTGQRLQLAMRQGLDDCVGRVVAGAQTPGALRRCESAPSLVLQPDGTVQSGAIVAASQPACMRGTGADGNGRGTVSFAACDEGAEGLWQWSGHNVRHQQSGLCLAMDPNEPGIDPNDVRGGATGALSLLPCNANDPLQSFAAGDVAQLRVAAKTAQLNLSVAELCAQPVPVGIQLPSPVDAETQWLLTHFGGDANALRAQVQQSVAQDCSVVWQRGQDVLPVPAVIVSFLPDEPSATAASNWVAGPLLNWNVTTATSNWARRAQADSYPDYVLHHELAHIWDRRALPYKHSLGLVEGYADLIAYRTGNRRPNAPQVKGGSFDDGYAYAMWFMLWLDNARFPAAVGQRYTDLEQRQALTMPQDPNWFPVWTQAHTGESLDALWADYQRSF